MPNYMLLLGGADLDKRSGNPNRAGLIRERFWSWLKSLQEKGRYVSSAKLHDQTGARLSMRGGQVVEGPFIEAKEAVGGIFQIQAGSLEEATQLARECPVLDLQNGYVEIRVLEDVSAGLRDPRISHEQA